MVRIMCLAFPRNLRFIKCRITNLLSNNLLEFLTISFGFIKKFRYHSILWKERRDRPSRMQHIMWSLRFLSLHSLRSYTSLQPLTVKIRLQRVYEWRKRKWWLKRWQRLTFPFPFVHLQPLDCKLEQLLTVETKSRGWGRFGFSTGCSSWRGCRVMDPIRYEIEPSSITTRLKGRQWWCRLNLADPSRYESW